MEGKEVEILGWVEEVKRRVKKKYTRKNGRGRKRMWGKYWKGGRKERGRNE